MKKKLFLPPYRGTGNFIKKDKNTGKKKPHLDFLSPIAPLSRRGGSVFLTFFPNKFPVLKTVSKNGPDSKMLYFFIDIRSRGAVDVIPFLAHFREIDISRKSHFLSVKGPFFGVFRFWPREISRLQNSMKISKFSFFNVAQKQGCVFESRFFEKFPGCKQVWKSVFSRVDGTRKFRDFWEISEIFQNFRKFSWNFPPENQWKNTKIQPWNVVFTKWKISGFSGIFPEDFRGISGGFSEDFGQFLTLFATIYNKLHTWLQPWICLF